MNKPVRLGDFILNNMELILREWEEFARTINPPALTMDSEDLRDHAELMLKIIAKDLGTSQTPEEQSEKSKGRAPLSKNLTPAHEHAEARLRSGFTMDQLFSEYRALRASVLNLWGKSSKEGLVTDPNDVTRFNEAIDQAIAESVSKFSSLIKSSQDMFLAILTHDLRNPLHTINMSSMILQQSDNDKVKTMAQRIHNSSERMNRLITDLTDYTRSQFKESLPTVLAPTHMDVICEDIINEQKNTNPNREFILNKQGKFNGTWDKDRIAQVFSNLLGNAIQHGSPSSPIVIDLNGNENSIIVNVNNKGTIPKNKIKTIFEPLSRGQDSDNGFSQRNSMGLGLYITRQIVLAHKGTIEVASSDMEGTTFSLKIPRECA